MIILRAYATIWDFFNSIFGTDIPSMPPNTYGFMLAIAFIVGIHLAKKELARKTALGIFPKATKKIWIGKGLEWSDILIYTVFGFVLGLKIGGFFVEKAKFLANTQDYILSTQGSIFGGIIGGLLFGGYVAYIQWKEKLKTPIEKSVSNNIEDRIGDLLIISMVGGVLGSKILDAIDNPASMAEFLTNPLGSLTAGLSILGGLIVVSFLLVFYAWKNKIPILPFTDSLAPPFFIAYAVGRLGCQFSGDGCWGISVQGLTKPSFLPDFLWGNTYAHNVNRDGNLLITGCKEAYCNELTEPHLPTPLYETIIVTILFLIIWKFRKRWTNYYGAITGLFLVFNGIERFLIEFVRVNTKYNYFGLDFSQAQYVSMVMILIGGSLMYWTFFIRKIASNLQ